ncbi:glycosyltransferase family 2 protein [Mangrovimonas xylaniphaga]|uniref:glycosyltransferase family 2 protein n=1 Tax=Mangrovimonas xylaniphaga TaxID=1645915 RepID=UPI0006B3FA5C|nr:glycosyltransferase family 2 protein [Mangrovimonas xylaniphaga]
MIRDAFSILVIIVTYNGSKWVDRCFSSLQNSRVSVDTLVIDNGSTDDTLSLIKTKYPEVEVIETGENLGFGKANNIGLKRVLVEGYEYAFLLNQDAWIEPDTLETLLKVSLQDLDLGIISPIHLNGQGDAIDKKFQWYLSPKYTPSFYSDLYLDRQKPYYISTYANAAAWLVTKKCISVVGEFDPLFDHYGEDDDYLNRLHKNGFKLGIVPTAKIYHDRPQEGKMNNKFYDNEVYFKSLLRAKNGEKAKKHFFWRKLIADYFVLYFVYFGKNDCLKKTIKMDILTLRLGQLTKKEFQKS